MASTDLMGRKPTVHPNMPPGMRPRTQMSGKIYHYLDTGGRPRKEIPLGDDYILALRKYVELQETAPVQGTVTSGDVMARYRRDVLPTLAKSTIATHGSDMKHFDAYFVKAPLGQVKPMHIRSFLDHFAKARKTAAEKRPDLAARIAKFWFYDLRATAADDTSDRRGEQAASDLLGHDSVKTTRRHYLRRGKIVTPTK